MTPTPRQLLILQAYEKDPSVKSVAIKFGVTGKTIEYHLKKLQQMLGVNCHEGLISWAFRSGLVYLLLLAPVSVKAQATNTATIYLQVVIDNTQLAGLSTNDYLTNLWISIVGTTNVTIPTNQWPLAFFWPCTQFTNQGLPPVWWTNQILVDSSPRFYLCQTVNGNGVVGPFSLPAPYFPTSPLGRINLKH